MLILISLVLAWYMTGLCWFVQAVAYPQFARVAVAEFAAYHKAHTTFTSLVVLPPMVFEMATGVALFWRSPHDWVFQASLGLIVVIWVNTFCMAVPLHHRLTRGHDFRVIRWLVRVNWIRSIAWLARGLLLLWAAGGR